MQKIIHGLSVDDYDCALNEIITIYKTLLLVVDFLEDTSDVISANDVLPLLRIITSCAKKSYDTYADIGNILFEQKDIFKKMPVCALERNILKCIQQITDRECDEDYET